ncbi:hypothetical protein PLICRDRAFT_160365 [Plicaturopsis crispa FD-325 SS-3]|nr:hypothetical protein PLICRDRAFT_160365 [Plicaturopsis crispa FD-325 SS-3]
MRSPAKRPAFQATYSRKKLKLDSSEGREKSIISDSEGETSDQISRRERSVSLGVPAELGPASSSTLIAHDDRDQDCIYSIRDDELVEDENLQVTGETEYDDDEGSVPVRVLTDFTIYNAITLELVSVAELTMLSSGTTYGASGIVRPWQSDEDDDEDEDDVVDDESEGDTETADQRVKLSAVTKFNVHDYSRARKRLDSKMYICTELAWYILDIPSEQYKPFFTEFWIRHRLLHLIVTSALNHPRITRAEFIQSLDVTEHSSDATAAAIAVLGRPLNEADLDSDEVNSYVVATLDDLQEQEGLRISRVPLVRTLQGLEPLAPSSSRRPSMSPVKKVKSTSNPEKTIAKNKTVVTARVAVVAQKLFTQALRIAGQLSDDVDGLAETNQRGRALGRDVKRHLTNPHSLKWIGSAGEDGRYNSVSLDGTIYSVGDTVMVVPGSDDDSIRATNAAALHAQSKNHFGNLMWFCKICYMFESEGKHLFHAQWYSHGSKTLLQEAAHANSLFLLNTCDDIDFNAVHQKCDLRTLAADEDEPREETDDDQFYNGLTFNEDDSSYIDMTETHAAFALVGQPCTSCGLRAQREMLTQTIPLQGGSICYRGTLYHVHDFIYLKSPMDREVVYQLGQIISLAKAMSDGMIVVRFLGRYDDVVRGMRLPDDHAASTLPKDERRLFQTDCIERVKLDQIDGIFYAKHGTSPADIDAWIQHADHFYVSDCADSTDVTSVDMLRPLSPDAFEWCRECRNGRSKALEKAATLLAREGPIRGLELFSGAGGMGTGFGLSGFVETRWAVEHSPSAALTYQTNHPRTRVYNQCSNLLLQHAIDTAEGKKPMPLTTEHGDVTLPPMPKPGEVDFIYGGPPCQSFSRANHCKKANDIRSTLVCNMVSYVEFYRPQYFLLENVEGFLTHSLSGRDGTGKGTDAIQCGVVKFVLRALICLGYQARFKVLQAGQYGSPQNRKRVIFWGAKRGIPLPEFPIPTHCFPRGSFFHSLPTGAKVPPVTRSKLEDNLHQSAPFHFVTVYDAISDLPAFDWRNPHVVCKRTPEDVAEAAERLQSIPCFDPLARHSVYCGFSQPTEYVHEPLTPYQRLMRRDTGDTVTHQYTRRFGEAVVERTVSVPIRPGANQLDLPRQLRPNPVLKNGNLRKSTDLYGRIDGNGYFKTAMTTVTPNAKGGTLLHPSQKRIVTVRECARAQGFPDHYSFCSVNDNPAKEVEDQHRQIGNAVPVPLAIQLGKSLGDALLQIWEGLPQRDGSPEV